MIYTLFSLVKQYQEYTQRTLHRISDCSRRRLGPLGCLNREDMIQDNFFDNSNKVKSIPFYYRRMVINSNFNQPANGTRGNSKGGAIYFKLTLIGQNN